MRIQRACALGLVAITLLWPSCAGTSILAAPLPPPKPDMANVIAVYTTGSETRLSLARGLKPTSDSSVKPSYNSIWNDGIEAWRAGEYQTAYEQFSELAKREKSDSWSRSGAAFWAARSAARLDDKRLAHGYLQLAARESLTFYGQIARHILREGDDKLTEAKAAAYPQLPAALKSALIDQGADLALVHAIIMQESRFNGKARSTQGAMGLMQVLPSTARHIDAAFKTGEALFDDTYNVGIGARYLQMIAGKPGINNQPVLILAAYNSGPHALAKWLRRAPADVKADPFLLIETYPRPQTRVYIEKVMANLWSYERVLNRPPTGSLAQLASSY